MTLDNIISAVNGKTGDQIDIWLCDQTLTELFSEAEAITVIDGDIHLANNGKSIQFTPAGALYYEKTIARYRVVKVTTDTWNYKYNPRVSDKNKGCAVL